VRITKVVVFCTTNPTKLVLYFSNFSKIFWRIYKILQKLQHYLRLSFANRPLKRTQTLQLGPWAQEAARIVGIQPREGWNRPGKGGVVLRGSPTTDSGGWTARRACRRGGLPAAGDGGRRKLCCGAAEARTEQGRVRVAVLGGQG
jgi:hypothetical protein